MQLIGIKLFVYFFSWGTVLQIYYVLTPPPKGAEVKFANKPKGAEVKFANKPRILPNVWFQCTFWCKIKYIHLLALIWG